MSKFSESKNMNKLRIAVAQMAVGKDKIANVAKARSYINTLNPKDL